MKARNHLEAVQAGVFDAVDGAIRNATSCPTADFFFSVQKGAESAIAEAIPIGAIERGIADGVRLAILELVRGKP